MSGHSKWSTIKRKKGAIDSKRGKIFTKLIKEITLAAQTRRRRPRRQLPPEAGHHGRQGREHAQGQHRPGRSRREPANSRRRRSYEEVTYEGYGPAGVAVIVDVMTDNQQPDRGGDPAHSSPSTAATWRKTAAVAWMFAKKGSILVDKKGGQRGRPHGGWPSMPAPRTCREEERRVRGHHRSRILRGGQEGR
ncbi:MAG: YebC/PmpR family DNA-binding transcriptional regulator [Desulfosudis oleivorans]|nr:YebC/PmpR family DNA-binding transcriptional regulator [Desulfosudis oleivorans]